MVSGDGLIVRLATGHRALHSSQARALAALAREHGNGQIELTQRANVQLRGVSEASLRPLQHALVEQGLASAREAPPEPPLLISPLAGLTAESEGLEPVARVIEPVLRSWLSAFPSKFGVVLDAAGSVRDVAADVRIELSATVPGHVEVHIAETWLGVCRSADSGDVLEQLLSAAQMPRLKHEPRALPRMRDLPDPRRLSVAAGDLWQRVEPTPRSASSSAPRFFGAHAGVRPWFGVGMPLGGDAPAWEALASLAERHGSGELRVTPARGVLLPDVCAADQAHLAKAARRYGWVVEASDPLLRVAACPGAPACSSGWGETRTLARRIAHSLAGRPGSAHVSGCAKGCARSAPADITLVHSPEGPRLAFNASAAEAAEQPVQPIDRIERELRLPARGA
jgi:precorrin-3B synthase